MAKFNGLTLLFVLLLIGCASSEIKPVDLFPEDQCAQCRMAVSNDAFASEIITEEGEVFKFDDLGCLEQFINGNNELVVGKIFVKDYTSRSWLAKEQSVIIQTSLKTPMGSGMVALADSVTAWQVVQQYPPSENADGSTESCLCCRVKGK